MVKRTYMVCFSNLVYNRMLHSATASLEENSCTVLDESFYSASNYSKISITAAINLSDPDNLARAQSGAISEAVVGKEAGLNGFFVDKAGKPIIWKYVAYGDFVVAYVTVDDNLVPDELKHGRVFSSGDSPGAKVAHICRLSDSGSMNDDTPNPKKAHDAFIKNVSLYAQVQKVTQA